ncbi:MAG: Rrf2 family transcriptional regulator, partial [Oscillospiraceae bacterium]
MHITKESDYAVRIVYCLACGDCRTDAKTISERTGVTLRFSLKILNKLVQSGIVKSYKGAKGGYELELPPKDISLKLI